MTLTHNIAGHEITLTAGRRYRAERVFFRTRDQMFDVTIMDITDRPTGEAVEAHVVSGLTYDQANLLIGGFNNGKTSYAGRLWS